MPIQTSIQTAFTGGEWSPRLLGRVDLETYTKATQTMINCYPFAHGGVTRRPGTCFVDEVRDSARPTRLVPFTLSRSQSYVLVFNAGRIEFLKNNGLIQSGGSPYSIAGPYLDDELDEFTYAQAGSVLFLSHPNHPPKQLVRVSDTNWVLSDVSFTTNAVTDTPFENNYVAFEIVAVGDGHDVNDFYEIVVDGAGNFTIGGPFNGSGGGTPVGSMVGVSVNQNNIVAQTWTVTCIVKSEGREEWDVVGNVSGRPPVQWSTGDYPRAVSFHAQRLFYAGSNSRPQTIWGSVAGDFANFTVGPEPNNGLNFTIASNNFDEIVHLESARQLLIFTASGEFTLDGSSQGIGPADIDIRRHTSHGSGLSKPIRIGQEILFVQRDLKKVRAVSYDVTLDANVAPELTILSEHITREDGANGVIDMTFAQDPDYVAWMVRDDGVLLSLTHQRDQEVTAWAKHETQGLATSITTIPTNLTDTVYVVVTRFINGQTKQYIEYICEGTYVDSNLSATSGTPTNTWSGLNHLEGQEVSIVADGKVQPNEIVTSGSIELQVDATDIIVGLPYVTTIELLHPEVPLASGTSQGRQLTIKSATLRVKDTVGGSVNTTPEPVISFPVTIGESPIPFTGDKKVAVLGWKSPNNLLIEQTLPMPFTLLAVILKTETND